MALPREPGGIPPRPCTNVQHRPWGRRKAAEQGGVGLARRPVQGRKDADVDPSNPATWGKVSRNAVCPCGSGKKYKHCHGRHE